VYIGPAKDFGWSHSHDLGRKCADAHIRGVETVYIEVLSDADERGAMGSFIEIENVDLAPGAPV